MKDISELPLEIKNALNSLTGETNISCFIVLYDNSNEKMATSEVCSRIEHNVKESEVKEALDSLTNGGLSRKQISAEELSNIPENEPVYSISEYGRRFMESIFLSLYDIDYEYIVDRYKIKKK